MKNVTRSTSPVLQSGGLVQASKSKSDLLVNVKVSMLATADESLKQKQPDSVRLKRELQSGEL
jgi:hypothetical protein